MIYCLLFARHFYMYFRYIIFPQFLQQLQGMYTTDGLDLRSLDFTNVSTLL